MLLFIHGFTPRFLDTRRRRRPAFRGLRYFFPFPRGLPERAPRRAYGLGGFLPGLLDADMLFRPIHWRGDLGRYRQAEGDGLFPGPAHFADRRYCLDHLYQGPGLGNFRFSPAWTFRGFFLPP